ncbi:CHAT domain-containing protein [uncultured Aquimarina sp.]|uniref:CHAT domain-containing protein n=1 Tax=uncultured Aquimarina sp. TaxID=575652 RepID=UPI00261843F8|nr:CHAT domain-containing protein [uncultured Aquimarina sp.]
MSATLDSIVSNVDSDTLRKRLYTELFNTYKSNNNYRQLGADAHELAKWYYRDKDKKNTIYYTELAIEAKKKAIPFDEELLKNSYINLGFFHRKYGNHEKAIKALKSAIPFKKKSLNIRAYNYLANSYDILQDPYNAVENRLQVFKYLDSKTDLQQLIDNHIKLAFSYRGFRDSLGGKKATQHLLTADSITDLISNPKKESTYLIKSNLGIQFYENNSKKLNLKTGIRYYKEALLISKQTSNKRHQCSSYYNLGLAHIDIDTILSKKYFDQSLNLVPHKPQLLKSIQFGYGKLAYKQEQYDKALSFYNSSIKGFLNNQNISDDLEPTLEDLNSVKKKSLLLEILKTKIKILNEQGIKTKNPKKYIQALKTLKIADQLIEIIITSDASYLTKLHWRDLASEIYIIGLEACYQANLLDKAFYLMEKNKALLLLQDLNRSKEELPEVILEKELAFKNYIASLEEKKQGLSAQQQDSIAILVFDKKTALGRFQDSIADDYPNHFLAKEIPTLTSLSAIKPQQNEIIIQYTMAERIAYTTPYGYGMMISNTGNQLFKLKGIDDILNNIKTLRRLLNQPFTTAENIITYRKTSNDIYNALFPEEIQATLKGKKVTIIPDHMLSMIPFEALVTDLDNSTYLIEDCEIDYAFSLTFRQQNAKISRKASQDFLGVAPVNFSKGLTALQNSNKEITTANAFYNGDLLLDQEATKENFIKKIKDYKILHLATHADASDSIAPWIAFRNSKLTDLELNSLQSQAELVVLSACNTSLGKISRGEGILSLARGFFKSGANTVIPSLWSTNDKATATITADFYKNLSEGQTKSAALRTAKLNYLHNNTDAEASPHYWASMILIGDTGTLLPQSNDLWMLWIGLVAVLLLYLVYFLVKKTR